MTLSVQSFGVLCALALFSCSGKKGEVEETTKKTIGAGGGEIALSGATLTIPAGALASDTEIVVSRLSGNVPEGYTASSPVFDLQPAGLTFSPPLQMALTFEGSSAGLAVFLTAAQGEGYERIAGVVNGQTITAPIPHFSRAFAGQGSAGTLSLDDWPNAQATIACRILVSCKNYTNEQACLTRLSAPSPTSTLQLDNLKKAVAAGRMVFDASAAKTCFDTLVADNSCRVGGDQLADIMRTTVPACDAMFTGKVEMGSDCYIDEECASGFCSSTSSACPGKCTAFKQSGETWTSTDRCAFPLIVYDGKCIPKAAGNASCAAIPPSKSNVSCEFGFYCDATSHVCTAAKTSGDCKGYGECAGGYLCDTQGTHTCIPMPGLNETCNLSKGLSCPSDLACVQPDSTTDGTCGPKRGMGQSCLSQYDCVSGHTCAGASYPATGTCQPKKAVQETCAYSADCADGLYCANKQCAPVKENGQTCESREECASVNCNTSKQCAPVSCTAP